MASFGPSQGQASAGGSVAIGDVTGLGTGVATALAVNVGSAGAPVIQNGALGTPSSGVATNLTGTAAGLTAGAASSVAVGGITGLGTGVATAIAVNVGTAGSPVVNGGALGTPSSGTATNLSGTAASLTAGSCTKLATGGTDNAILRADGTGGGTSQGSASTLSDSEVLNLANAAAELQINGTKVVDSQQTAIADAAAIGSLVGAETLSMGNVSNELTALKDKINVILAMLRTHGLIAT